MKFKKVAIVGVGLIGGSIGLAIKKRHIAREVVGVFRRESTLKRALKARAVDRGTLSIAEGVEGADLIILASPVCSIPALAKKVIRSAKKGAIITDAGSTKKWIVGSVEKMIGRKSGVSFVGSHPMAGSEHAGVEFAREDLVEGSPCLVTRTARTDKRSLAKIVSFWRSLGGKVDIMTPEAHDRAVSLISHLPHLVAFSLAGAVPSLFLKYAAEGFKDTTRVASSDPELWVEIFSTNRSELLRSAKAFAAFYNKLTGLIKRGRFDELKRLLGSVKSRRDGYFA